MSFDNFLSGGITFSEDEDDLAFRIRLLNAIALTAFLTASTFTLFHLTNINPLGRYQPFFTAFLCVVSLFSLMYLRGRKEAFNFCAWLMILTSYVTFSTTIIFILNDEHRIFWYFNLVVATYFLVGRTPGFVITLACLAAVALGKFVLDIPFSSNGFFTFVLSLCVASGVAHAHSRLANSYFERLQRSYRQMKSLASTDPLTGLSNARAFYDVANKSIQYAQRSHSPYCALFIDIDHFKSINDTYGHEFGDIVLCNVARCIASNVRNSDIVGRIGGEEFVVFLPDTEASGAQQIAEKLRGKAEALVHGFPEQDSRKVTLSIGVAQNNRSDQLMADIQKRADSAMYDAKKNGRNRVSVVSPEVA